MAYQVIKTIKGKKYLYSQSTYREDGKVKTISQYIGAMDNVSKNNSQSINYSKESSQQLTPEEKPKLTLHNLTFKLKPIVKISQSGLENDYRKATHKLEKYGIDLSKFPSIVIKHGKENTHYKPAFRDSLIITTPKKPGGREKLRKEYRLALHRGFIETLEKEAPEKIAPFKYAFDKAYKDTQDSLTSYLLNCNSKGSFALVLALKIFSFMNPVPTGKNQKLPPHKLGLINYGKREDWKKDYCEIMAEIDRKGIDSLYNQANKEIAISNKTQRETIKKKTIFFLRKRKTVKRLQARIEANHALLRKLNLLKEFRLL